MIDYQPPDRSGYLVMEVLPQLKMHPLDNIAWSLIDSLRPSYIRIIRDGIIKSDARTWRVTIYLNSYDQIEFIEQEVTVGLRGPYTHGHDLSEACRKQGIKLR